MGHGYLWTVREEGLAYGLLIGSWGYYLCWYLCFMARDTSFCDTLGHGGVRVCVSVSAESGDDDQ